ncbi:MAG: hypothetical protein IE880_02010 [Epsilonproteobacteria bacterium]|nr:hypothetical protein [Campylobacterota bacterium]
MIELSLSPGLFNPAEQNANKVARSKMTPRELLADDVRMLRKYGVPNSQIILIINMNKAKYGLTK